MAYRLETLIARYQRYTEAERWKELDPSHPLFLAMKELENIFIVNEWILRRVFVRAFIVDPTRLLEVDGIYIAQNLSLPIPVSWNTTLEPSRNLLQTNLKPTIFRKVVIDDGIGSVPRQETKAFFISQGSFQKGGQRFLSPSAILVRSIIKPQNFVETIMTL